MQMQSENIEGIVGKIEHDAPAGQHHAIAVEWRYRTIIGINQSHQPLVFAPATKMNNGKQYEEAPVIPQQADQHYHHKDDGSEGSCFECSQVERHERNKL